MGIMDRRQQEAVRVMKLYYKCATDEQYREWREAARNSRPSISAWFCTDCTPAYQKKMLAQEKCVRPEIKFKLDEDGGHAGYVSFLTNARSLST
jgi:hypothetical protein